MKPTGTFILFIFSFGFLNAYTQQSNHFSYSYGGIVRGDSSKEELSLVFTADEYGEGLSAIIKTLRKQKVKGSFFFTGRFYRNKQYKKEILQLKNGGHYLGPHSDQHLLYCDWTKRDSLLVNKDSFENDIAENTEAMKTSGVPIQPPHYFIPPYEWWNDSIARWSKENGLQIINFTPGIRTNADYTWPELSNYKSSEWIINWLKEFIQKTPNKLNGSIILIHAGTDPKRTDKLYSRLNEFITILKKEGYQLVRVDNLLNIAKTEY
ncbi:MAG: polysaccharide deacetylase family protein [Chitinophagaceae bacterium]|nr:MAG: polysaccharide deacetylase family protein [Chitinophagaceae bacterium]